ncbi:MAG TPA: Hsp70 family protein, partial [Chthoniobacteraceae bacterium]|nr:Hsp70 family protein [Chthoniobacteraceae bacterium]
IVGMQSAVDVSDEAVEKMISESIEHAFDDMSERVFTEAKMKASEMLPAVHKALALAGDGLDAAEKEKIAALVSEVETAMESGEAPRLKRAIAALDEGTQHLAALLVERAMEEARKRK